MADAYASAGEHLDDTLALIGTLTERQITAAWEFGTLPKVLDRFSGSYVGGAEVQALFASKVPSEDGAARLRALDAKLGEQAAAIEARLGASAAAGTQLPFDRLRTLLDLSPTEERALLTLAAFELSPRLRQLMRYLVNEASRANADVGLLETLVYSSAGTRQRLVSELGPHAPLMHHRLVESIGRHDDAPFLMRPLRAARRVLELLHGELRLDPELGEVATLIAKPERRELLMATDVQPRVDALVAEAAAGARVSPIVVLAGREGSGRRSLLEGAAAAAGLTVLRVRCARLGSEPERATALLRALVREAILHHALLVLEGLDDLGEAAADRMHVIEDVVAGFRGPISATVASQGGALRLSRGAVRVDVAGPTEPQREELWRRRLGVVDPGLDLTLLSARYSVTGGLLERAAAGALAMASARKAPVAAEDVHAGMRSVLDEGIGILGSRVTSLHHWDDLVLNEEAMDSVKEIIYRIQHRRRVYEEWGMAEKLRRGLGLVVLFAGPPGTGKTMVAGIIARDVGLDLYQVDLSRIVSKYVGETEKNLAQLFDAAESGHAILLFDEADSLFAQRGEVKSSVDRYANLEVNYLLQRVEAFRGTIILTTNMASSMDPAFRRRIAIKVDFPMPEQDEREALWRTLTPERARAESIDFATLARRYEMSGGNIRNAVLRAAFLAAGEDTQIALPHLRRAAEIEYAAMGKVG